MWKLFAMVLVVSDTGSIATSQIATDFATVEACHRGEEATEVDRPQLDDGEKAEACGLFSQWKQNADRARRR
jgi:hypothetical protein